MRMEVGFFSRELALSSPVVREKAVRRSEMRSISGGQSERFA